MPGRLPACQSLAARAFPPKPLHCLMQILKNSGGVAMTNSFLVADEKLKQAVVFDVPTILPATCWMRLPSGGGCHWPWLTHGHFDHFADHAVVRQRFPGVKVLIHALDEAKARNPDIQTRMFGLPFVVPPSSRTVT